MDAREPRPGIDLRRLETLQRGVQYAATGALVITLALFGLASSKLAGINRELAGRQTKLTEADENLTKRQRQIVDLDAKIKTLENRLDTVNGAIRAIDRPGAIPTPGPQPAVTIPARVYIQIFNDAQRLRARDLQSALESGGFVVPGIENVGRGGRSQSTSDVRFYAGNIDTSDVPAIRQIATRFGVTLKEIPLPPSSGVRPRHYEIWLGTDFH